ncbi:MAG: hypothetical protein H0V74_01420 [Chloroflexi bacterium]|nr:hypothetical protein [Chloroflexota bacterium]
MARRNRRHGRTTRRVVGTKLLEIAVTLAFLALMITVVLPWAGAYLADGIARQIQAP